MPFPCCRGEDDHGKEYHFGTSILAELEGSSSGVTQLAKSGDIAPRLSPATLSMTAFLYEAFVRDRRKRITRHAPGGMACCEACGRLN